HAVAFFKDGDALMTYGRKYFKNTREPFLITLVGEKLAILTAPQDVAAMWKNTETLSFDPFFREIYGAFGVTSDATHTMCQTPSELPRTGDAEKQTTMFRSENPMHKSMSHLQMDIFRMQLHPGEKLDSLGVKFMGYINRHLQWESLQGDYVLSSSTNSTMKTISLYKWTRDVLVDSATRTFCGEKILEIDPMLAKHLYEFDACSWKLICHYPQFLAKDVLSVKKKIVSALVAYLELPKADRLDASWMFQTLESEQRQLGIDNADIASAMLLVFWVINVNAHKVCFWILAHAMRDPSLLSTLRTETAPAILSQDTDVDMPYLLNRCPHLEALYHEVLRYASSGASLRSVIAPTVVGNSKVLPVGTKVLGSYQQLHYDESVFGDDTQEFKVDRFLRPENAGLTKGKSFRPFGGGPTYCPGRFVAKQEVFVFVAAVLARFDISMATTAPEHANGPKKGGGEERGTESGQTFPRIDRAMPFGGVMPPIEGDDMILHLTPRRQD
ncbi:hypothetical protein MMC07_009922, partial [Pseudocyphellaria aurata]|nr:hypothetical protein [Pseudocyphellaria aurata]